MIVAIRIHGQVGLKKDIVETLNRLRIRRKYACVVLNETKINLGMIKKVREFVAYGEINKETLFKLITKRGRPINKNKKIDFAKATDEMLKGKKPQDSGMKPFFRLHPPIKGINTKLNYPKGALGNHKQEINKLIERML